MEPTEITAGRLHLRPWQPADAAPVLAACQDPLIQRWTSVPSPYTRADALAFVSEVAPAGWRNGSRAQFAVLDATQATLLGSVGLLDLADGSAEIGYWTAPEARGAGVTTDAVSVVCRWGFGALGLQRVAWRAQTDNHGSRAVAEKAGFTVAGTLRRGLLHRGRLVDCWAGSLLPDDEPDDRRAFGAWRDLAGEGLLLRRWRDDERDAAALVAGCADPVTARWVPVSVPYSPATAQWCLREQYPRDWSEGRAAHLAVEAAGRVVGYLVLILRGTGCAPELGWWTSPGARGQGVAGRAAPLLAEWAHRLGHRRVEARVDVDNQASQRAAVKAGFVQEGVLRGAGRDRAGQPRDQVLFGRVAAEPGPPRPGPRLSPVRSPVR